MIKQLKEFIASENLFNAGTPLLIAVSGGVDSMVLVNLISSLNQPYAFAHCNFQLRGDESDADEQFVKELASTVKVECFTERFDTKEVAQRENISIQMAARKLRYDWLEEVRVKNNFHFIVTAHHRDDSVETVLLNLTRGTGIKGLHGILPKHEKIVRPFLFASKNEIRKYAEENKIAFREDSSNLKDDYQRNLIRHKVIPLLEEINPSFLKTMDENSKHILQHQNIFNFGANKLLARLVKFENGNAIIDIAALKKSPSPSLLLYEFFRPFGFTEETLNEVLKSLDGESGKEFLSPVMRIIKDRKKLFITNLQISTPQQFLIEKKKSQTIIIGEQKIEMRIKSAASSQRNGKLEMDADKISFPLTLRKWKAGDFFYPAGMKMKKKKLSNFFVDLKMPLHEKEKQLVLQDATDKIICVVGLRADERVAVSKTTKEYFVVTAT